MNDDSHQALHDALLPVREYLQLQWGRFHRNRGLNEHSKPLSKGMCLHTCLFLRDLMREAGDDSWSLVGGRMMSRMDSVKPSLPVTSRDGRWQSDEEGRLWWLHWWLSDGMTIIDLTPDQFGWEVIRIFPVDVPFYVVRPDLCDERYFDPLVEAVAQWSSETHNNSNEVDAGGPEPIWEAHKTMKAGFLAAWPDIPACQLNSL